MNNLRLIPAIESDRDFFRKTHHAAYRRRIEPMFGWDESAQKIYANKEFDERNPHIILQGEDRAGVVGWQDHDDHILFGPIYILPEFQGKGLGTAILQKFIAQSEAEKKEIRLRTLLTNTAAKEFYEKLGFVTASSTQIHWHLVYR